jgi:alpha-glucoside transport system substrate-binding protein
MKRRFVLIALLALIVPAFAAGCGGDGDEGAPQGTTAAEGGVSGSISVMGIWVGPEQESFQAVIDAFQEQNPDVDVKYNPAGDELPTVLSTAVEGGNPPDIAAPAQPGLVQQLVDRDALQPIEFARNAIEENFPESVVEVGVFNDELYGLLFKTQNKSLVWYNVQAFEDAGVEPTETWDELLQSAETLKAAGIPAFSIGGSEGWTLTDLFENIYIRTAGAEKYDQLSRHEIPWTDQSVKDALTEMAKVVGDPDNIAGGTAGALQSDFATSVSNVLSESPKAAMVLELEAVPGVVESPLEAGTGYDVFEFPSIDDSPPSVVGAGNLAVMLKDSPAARAFIEFLATPEAADAWASRGGFLSPNTNLDPSVYPDELSRRIGTAVAEAEVYRFDLSDVVPAEFGATEGQGLWKLFQDFVQNPDDIDGIAKQLEQAASQAE